MNYTNRIVLTNDATKRHAKRLKQELFELGLDLKLNESLNLFARALGVKDYHELQALLPEKESKYTEQELTLQEIYEYMFEQDQRDLLITEHTVVNGKRVTKSILDEIHGCLISDRPYQGGPTVHSLLKFKSIGTYVFIWRPYIPFQKLNIDYKSYLEPGLHFVLGSLGSGKSTVLSNIIHYNKFEFKKTGYVNSNDHAMILDVKTHNLPEYMAWHRNSNYSDIPDLNHFSSIDIIYLDDVLWDRTNIKSLFELISLGKSVIVTVHGFDIGLTTKRICEHNVVIHKELCKHIKTITTTQKGNINLVSQYRYGQPCTT